MGARGIGPLGLGGEWSCSIGQNQPFWLCRRFCLAIWLWVWTAAMIFLDMIHCMSVVGRLREGPMMILYCFSWFLPGPLGPTCWHQPINFASTAANGDTDTSSTIVPQPYVSIVAPISAVYCLLQATCMTQCGVSHLTELHSSMQLMQWWRLFACVGIQDMSADSWNL